MGKSTISITMFNSFLYVYQRVCHMISHDHDCLVMGKIGKNIRIQTWKAVHAIFLLVLMIKLMVNAKMENLVLFDYVKWKETWVVQEDATEVGLLSSHFGGRSLGPKEWIEHDWWLNLITFYGNQLKCCWSTWSNFKYTSECMFICPTNWVDGV